MEEEQVMEDVQVDPRGGSTLDPRGLGWCMGCETAVCATNAES